MKRSPVLSGFRTLLAITLSVSTAAQANQVFFGDGFSHTTGLGTNPFNLASSAMNPASLSFLVKKDNSNRFSLFPASITAGLEVGNVNGFETLTKEFSDLVKQKLTKVLSGSISNYADIKNVLDNSTSRASDILKDLGPNGKVVLSAQVSPMILPMVFQSEALSGSVGINAGVNAQIREQMVAAPVETNLPATEDLFKTSTITQYKLSTDTGFNLNAVFVSYLGLGYATNPIKGFKNVDDPWGRIDVGARLNLYSFYAASRYLVADSQDFANASYTAANNGKWLGMNFGLDLGALHSLPYGQWGFTWYNINSPSFKYPSVLAGNNVSAADTAAINRQASRGAIDITKKQTIGSHLVLEGNAYLPNRAVLVQASYGLQKVEDLVGNEVQYFSVSTTLTPHFESAVLNFIPTLRLGYTKNLVGSQLGLTSIGTTLFRIIHIDVWGSLGQSTRLTANTASILRSFGGGVSVTQTF